MSVPKLTIVLPTYNAESDLVRFFRSFYKQRVPKSWIELLIVDGGSTDGTYKLARKYGARVIYNPEKLAEPGVWRGCLIAKAPLIMILAADIAFPSPDTIRKIVGVFKNKTIVAAYPKFICGPRDSVYSRYFNAFSEPFTHFVYGDATNYRTFSRMYSTILHTDNYDVYDFSSNPVYPGLGFAHGFTIRKESLPPRREKSDDFLVVYSLIRKKARLAYVFSAPVYHYVIRDFKQFVLKERRSVENALLRGDSGITIRTYYLTPGQKVRMYLFFPYAFSIVIPLVRSIVNAVRFRESAWLLHWYMTLWSAIIICSMVISVSFRKIARGKRN